MPLLPLPIALMVALLVVLVKQVPPMTGQRKPNLLAPIASKVPYLKLLLLAPVPIALPEQNRPQLVKRPVKIVVPVNGPMLPLPNLPLVARLVLLVKKVLVAT